MRNVTIGDAILALFLPEERSRTKAIITLIELSISNPRAIFDALSTIPLWVVADKGYVSDVFREWIWDIGVNRSFPQNNVMHQSPAQNRPIGVNISL